MAKALPIPYEPNPIFRRKATPIWMRRGGYVAGGLSAVNHQRAHDEFGVKTLFVQLATGSTPHEANIKELNLIEPVLRRLGFSIAGWGPVFDDALGAAQKAVELTGDLRLDGWVSNHEAHTEAHSGNSAIWLNEYRKWWPLTPLLLSCLPGPRPASLDPLVWLNAGADIAPQCYQGEVGAVGAVAWSANYWLKVYKIPRVRLHPVLGVDKNNHPWSMAQYISEMQAWGLGGYSYWHLAAISPAGV